MAVKTKQMPDQVRLHILLSSNEFADFERFRNRERGRTKKEAVRELIALGLRAVEDSSTNSA